MRELSEGAIRRYSQKSGCHGLDIQTSANLLRRYAFIERGLMRMLAGWFLAAPAYEMKYAFGYHLRDHAEHADWIRTRLAEMRGGLIRASAEPALTHCIEETLHAPDAESFVVAAYLELESALLDCYRDHLSAADSSANAAEIRIIERLIPATERHVAWAREQIASVSQISSSSPHPSPSPLPQGERSSNGRVLLNVSSPLAGEDKGEGDSAARPEVNAHRELIRKLLGAAGGISGLEARSRRGGGHDLV